MATVSDFRRANLIRQIERHGSADNLAAAVDLAPSYLSQIKTGKRECGPRTARKLEAALSLPHGSFDIPPPGYDLDKQLAALLANMSEKDAIKVIIDALPGLSPAGVKALTAALLSRLSADE